MTGLALLASYIEEIRIGLTRLGNMDLTFSDGNTISVANATFIDFMNYYEVNLMNPKVLSGMFLGSMMAFLFCGLTMNAVGRAAGHMVDEVRRQFREIKGILTGEAEPDYERCVEISTKEEGNFGGKGSEVHKATVVGDTVGDPFKDTSGPSLNILIKLMSMVAIVMAGLTVAWSLF